MRVDEELMDVGILGEGFQLTHLWRLREVMLELRETLEELKEKTLSTFQTEKVVDIESRLYYVNRNLEMVEAVMTLKELDIFEVTEFGEICSN